MFPGFQKDERHDLYGWIGGFVFKVAIYWNNIGGCTLGTCTLVLTMPSLGFRSYGCLPRVWGSRLIIMLGHVLVASSTLMVFSISSMVSLAITWREVSQPIKDSFFHCFVVCWDACGLSNMEEAAWMWECTWDSNMGVSPLLYPFLLEPTWANFLMWCLFLDWVCLVPSDVPQLLLLHSCSAKFSISRCWLVTISWRLSLPRMRSTRRDWGLNCSTTGGIA